MKRFPIFLAIAVLLLASLACQAALGGGDEQGVDIPEIPDMDIPEIPEVDIPDVLPTDILGDGSDSEFPVPDGATNVMDIGGILNFQVEMSIQDTAAFYQEKMKELGYTEAPLLTVIEEAVFSLVFEGHESGKQIIVQGVDLGQGLTNVNIRLE